MVDLRAGPKVRTALHVLGLSSLAELRAMAACWLCTASGVGLRHDVSGEQGMLIVSGETSVRVHIQAWP